MSHGSSSRRAKRNMIRTKQFCLYACIVVWCVATMTKGSIISKFNHVGKLDNKIRTDEDNFINGTIIECASFCNDHQPCGAFIVFMKRNKCQLVNIWTLLLQVDNWRPENDTMYFVKQWIFIPKVTTAPAILSTATERVHSCPKGNGTDVQIDFPDESSKQYRVFFNMSLSHHESKNFCKLQKGTLPMILTEQVQDVFIKLLLNPCLKDTVNGGIWVDGKSGGDSRVGYYTSGSPSRRVPEDTSLWAPGKPDNPLEQQCITMNKGFQYMFDDLFCRQSQTMVICELSNV